MVAVTLVAAACGSSDPSAPLDSSAPIPPGEDLGRDVLDTALSVDVAVRTATAAITLGASGSQAVSFEIGDLDISTVTLDGAPLLFSDVGNRLDIGVPASDAPLTLTVDFSYQAHGAFDGADGDGFTFLWPYHCGNLFPCHSDPADGSTFTLALAGVDASKTAVFPASIPADAPSYMLAWAIGDYLKLDLGATSHGTAIAAWHRASETAAATSGTAHLREAFQWFEDTLGPYRFGAEAGSVAISWGPGAYGGMEHHPYWHVAASSMASEETHVHEAAHGWFGDGIRILCWEDFVLSEGTVSYLAARALEVIAPSVGQAVWTQYQSALGALSGTSPVWPDSCNAIDVLEDGLYSNAPYMRGAFFYRAVALRVGADALDEALASFYGEYAGKAARMTDMLRVIREVTGFDPTGCAQSWLRATSIPAVAACP
jgi:aminopeptidase N